MTFQRSFFNLREYLESFDCEHQNQLHQKDEFPPVILSEDYNFFHLQVLVPGLSLKDIKLTFKENQLEIIADFKKEPYLYISQKRPVMQARRYINFDACIDTENITSQLNNGLLCIKLPKVNSPEIEIQTQFIN